MELTVLGLSFTLLLILGVPVAFAIGLSSVVTILVAGLPAEVSEAEARASSAAHLGSMDELL
jgi:hypothetical protein